MREAVLRSWLLTDSPSEVEFAAAMASGADVVILDRGGARRLATPHRGSPRVAVSIGEATDDDLDAIMRFAPWAILAVCRNGADVQRLGAKLAVFEARRDLSDGATRIVARISDARSILNLASFVGASPRLAALLFDVSGPSAQLSRSLVALGAGAADVAAIDGAGEPMFFRDQVFRARDENYSGKIATTLDEVEMLNAVFGANQSATRSSLT